MKKFKSLITEFGQESGAVDYWDGSFIGEYLVRIGIEDVEFSSEKRLDSGEFLGKEVTIVIWDSESEVPKQELPVIPKYVADWIEAERGTMSNWKLPSRFISDSKYKKDQRRYKWSQVEGNMDKFMSSLINSYEVEEEPLYHALIKGHEVSNFHDIYWNYDKSDDGVFVSRLHPTHDNFLNEMSKGDWNKLGINDSNADFVKVEE